MSLISEMLRASEIGTMVRETESRVVARSCGMEFTLREMHEAFDRVKNPAHWKLPIDARVEFQHERELIAVKEAVRFFAGCEARVVFSRWIPESGHAEYRVTAPGYFAAVGA